MWFSRRRRRRLLRVFRAARHAPETGRPAGAAASAPAPARTTRGRHRAPTPAVAAAARGLVGTPSRRVALGACAVLAALAAHAATSDAYRVHGAAVRGNARLSAAAVYEASGLEGAHALGIDRAAVARRVVESLGEVRAARVGVRLPARITLTVEETRPLLAWRSGPSELLVDETGLAIAPPADDPSLAALPRVTDLGPEPLGLGARVPGARLDAALAYAGAFGDLVYRPADGFAATLADGAVVRLGEDAAQLPAQRIALEALRGQIGRPPGGLVVDLRFPAHPSYRLAPAGGTP